MRRLLWVATPPVFAFIILVLAAWLPHTDMARQMYNIRRAEELLPRVQTIVDANPRFKDIRVQVYTGQGGAVGLFGVVETPEDLLLLMRKVASAELPITVAWYVTVHAEEKRQ